jgi:hypothetical protein
LDLPESPLASFFVLRLGWSGCRSMEISWWKLEKKREKNRDCSVAKRNTFLGWKEEQSRWIRNGNYDH